MRRLAWVSSPACPQCPRALTTLGPRWRETTRIVHTSDTHLGFSAYSRLDPATGVNQRETDVYDAFELVVDYAIEKHVDAIVHAGDLFDGVRPNNRAISFLFRQLSRLLEAGIPFVVV